MGRETLQAAWKPFWRDTFYCLRLFMARDAEDIAPDDDDDDDDTSEHEEEEEEAETEQKRCRGWASGIT